MLDEGGAGPVNHLEHQIESVRAPVVRVRYIEVPIRARVEFPEQGEYGVSPTFALQVTKVAQVTSIHREDVVELEEVFGPDAPRASSEWDPVPPRNVGGPRIGRLSFVPRPSASRVDPDPIRQIFFFQSVRQDPFSERRTTDVAQAYEKNGDVVFRGHGRQFSAGRRPLKVWNPGA